MPGELGVWLFIAGEFLVFSLFFMVFLHQKSLDPKLYSSSQARINQTYGLINTMLMLSSSWLVATAVQAARQRAGQLARKLLFGACLCGIGFGFIKYLEYAQKVAAGITPLTNDFFTYYFVFTGIHLMHVAIGVAVLFILTRYLRNRPIEGSNLRNLESAASFWHLVDLLWIILFALFYMLK